MSEHEAKPAQRSPRAKRWRRIGIFVALWAAAAYLLVPLLWEAYYRRHPDYASAPHLTHTGDHHPGDPVNLALVGTEAEVQAGMKAAGWFVADALGLKSDLQIGVDSVLGRPDANAPVSNLFLFGRKEDLAYEKPVGDNPRQRHHVRFWRWDKTKDGEPVWFGSATYDERVGLSHTTGQVTHHIGPDVDAERDRIAAELGRAGCVQGTSWLDGFQKPPEGRNGGGDPWRTDGRLAVVELRACTPR
ncbi:MAG: LssY C-terminal domain-containing protein [Burkholderiales bacterium]